MSESMTLWRLEALRLRRTHRWLVLVGVYAACGVIGPLSARYIGEFVERFGGGVEVIVPDPRPVDGLVQFVSNAGQLGTLAVVAVAAAALAMDARPERAAFLRTRVERPARLVLPPYVATTAAAVVALAIGSAAAWALTAALIGAPPAGAVVLGTALGAVFLAFVVALVAAVAGVLRTLLGTVVASLLALLALPALGVLEPVAPWLPTDLVTAVVALAEGGALSDHARAAAVSVAATAGLLAFARHRAEHREL